MAAHAVTRYRGDTGLALDALAISPDGKVVVFVRGGDGEHTPNPASLVQPPKRRVIAAAADGSGEPRVLLPARVHGTAPEAIARELVPPEFPERELVVPQPVARCGTRPIS